MSKETYHPPRRKLTTFLTVDQFVSCLDDPKLTKKYPHREWRARCPVHDDRNPSLHVTETHDPYKPLVTCFAGCKFEDIMREAVRRYHTQKRSQMRKGITLQDYACYVGVPGLFLEELGIYDKDGIVFIPYYRQQGEPGETITRKRLSLEGPFRHLWPKGTKTYPYGIWECYQHTPDKPLFLVEGETDAITLWFYGFRALGIPGQYWKPAWNRYVQNIETIFVIREPGARLPEAVKKHVPHVIVIDIENYGYKDIRDAHIRLKGEFPKFITELISAYFFGQIQKGSQSGLDKGRRD